MRILKTHEQRICMQNITKKTLDSILSFLQLEVEKRGFTQVVVGLSGGIDSAVVSVLCNMALGGNIKALLMPSLNSSQASIDDSIFLCENFRIDYDITSIKDLDSVFCNIYKSHTKLSRGNFCARMRMAMLYHVAQMENRLVVGTSNKTEIMLGYGTIFGDLACAINPIGNLYKTQIYMLAKLLDIPTQIINKPPSADLYEGQTDEKELGYGYDEIDPFLEFYEKVKGDITKLTQYNKNMTESLYKRIQNNTFKQKMPTIFIDLEY